MTTNHVRHSCNRDMPRVLWECRHGGRLNSAFLSGKHEDKGNVNSSKRWSRLRLNLNRWEGNIYLHIRVRKDVPGNGLAKGIEWETVLFLGGSSHLVLLASYERPKKIIFKDAFLLREPTNSVYWKSKHFKTRAIKIIRKNGFYDERDLNKNDTLFIQRPLFWHLHICRQPV